jgi:hypothetical protein
MSGDEHRSAQILFAVGCSTKDKRAMVEILAEEGVLGSSEFFGWIPSDVYIFRSRFFVPESAACEGSV